MGTRAFKPEPEASEAEKTARIAITGDSKGSVRRPLLYAAAALGLVLATVVPPVGVLVGAVALLLLAVADVG